MKRYYSNVGIGISLFLLIALGGTAVMEIIDKDWYGLIVIIIIAAFFVFMYFSTYYEIVNEKLIIKGSFLLRKEINIDSINTIEKTRNSISSPAYSLKRMEIKYNDSEFILISPRKSKEFMNHLKNINPNINLKGFEKAINKNN